MRQAGLIARAILTRRGPLPDRVTVTKVRHEALVNELLDFAASTGGDVFRNTDGAVWVVGVPVYFGERDELLWRRKGGRYEVIAWEREPFQSASLNGVA